MSGGRDGREWERDRGRPGGAAGALDEERDELGKLRLRLALERRMVQRKAERDGRGDAAARAPIPQAGGEQLDGAHQKRLERALGADLSAMRVHTGGASAKAAEARGARALTVGTDVHFAAGEFAPGSLEGDRLLAHEATHVVQGARSGIARKADEHDSDGGGEQVSQPHEAAEQEADAVADGAVDAMHADQGDDEEGGDGSAAPPEEIEAARAQLDGAEGDAEGGEAGEGEGGAVEAASSSAAPVERAPAIGAKLEPGVIHAAPKGGPMSFPQGIPRPGSTVKADPGRNGSGKVATHERAARVPGGPVAVGEPRAPGLSVKARGQQAAQLRAEKSDALIPTSPADKKPAKAATTAEREEIEERIRRGDRTVSRDEIAAVNTLRRLNNKRKRGVAAFWSSERQRLLKGEKPTRNWTPEQRADILAGNVPKGPDGKEMEGHHMWGVKDYPQAAGAPGNIYPATDKEHTDRWHGGDTKADTDGKPRNPKSPEQF